MTQTKSKKEKKISKPRPPVVVILGHVDHGKTTLLDKIRQSNLVAKEPGMITQKIGAYQVEVEAGKDKERKKITFIDTPGHEVFTKMRKRGAKITDMAILVVAADDGVKPQTQESIKHLKETKTPFIVALNKTDLPSANQEKAKKQLVKEEVVVESLGGEIVCVAVSAKTGQGVKELLEMILLFSEMEGLKADPQGALKLAVVESKIDSRRGPVATVIVQEGTLHQGETVEIGGVESKIRGMFDENGKKITEAPPSTPVEILGLKELPAVGETSQKKVQDHGEKEGGEEKLKVILKADTGGSLEAVLHSLSPQVEVISQGVGEISESGVLLAKTSGAIILGFNLKTSASVRKLAETEGVLLKTYNVIYELLDELEEAVLSQGTTRKQEKILGRAKIIAQFPFNKEQVAGCQVIEGKISRDSRVKIVRKDEEIGKAKVKSIRRLKEEIPKAEEGSECGILFTPSLDFQAGDVIISYNS